MAGPPEQPDQNALLALAVRAAAAGAAVIREAAPRARSINWQSKSPTDFVSEVDVAAEAQVLAVLVPALKDVTVFAEESANQVAREDLAHGLAVVVDPLDGTTNFLHGFPEFAVSVAILRDGVPVAACVHNVPRGEVFTATQGGGAYLNGERIGVSTIADPLRALIGTGLPFKDVREIEPYLEQMRPVMAGVSGLRRPGAASLDLASVAAGRFDAFWERELMPWDFAAGMLLIQEAGGVITTLSGEELRPFAPTGVMAGNPRMYEWLKDTLTGV